MIKSFQVVDDSGSEAVASVDDVMITLGLKEAPAPSPSPSPEPVFPDLIIRKISITPTEPKEGDAILFSAEVHNEGDGATPDSQVIGVRFDLRDSTGQTLSVTWSDLYSKSLAPGEAVTLSANGGPGGVKDWQAVSGTYTVTATVDDVNRIPDERVETNNTLSGTISVLPPTSVKAGSLYELQQACKAMTTTGRNEVQITSMIALGTSVLTAPAVPQLILRGIPGQRTGIQHSGADQAGLVGVGNRQREVKCYDLTFNGGWQNRKAEGRSDGQPVAFPDYDNAEFWNCTFEDTTRAGVYVERCRRAFFDHCTFQRTCRDGTWANNVEEFWVQYCTFNGIRDDAGSCHVKEGVSLPNRIVRFLNNEVIQGFEVKFLGGGDVLIEGNTMRLMGPAAILLGIDPTTGEGGGTIHTGYVVRNNLIEYPLNTTQLFQTGKIRMIEIYAPGKPTGVLIEGNTFKHLDGGQQKLSKVYPNMTRLFDKTGWMNDPTLTPENDGIRILSANATDQAKNIVRNNTFVGAWSYQLSRQVG